MLAPLHFVRSSSTSIFLDGCERKYCKAGARSGPRPTPAATGCPSKHQGYLPLSSLVGRPQLLHAALHIIQCLRNGLLATHDFLSRLTEYRVQLPRDRVGEHRIFATGSVLALLDCNF